jgi:hypothetical protein
LLSIRSAGEPTIWDPFFASIITVGCLLFLHWHQKRKIQLLKFDFRSQTLWVDGYLQLLNQSKVQQDALLYSYHKIRAVRFSQGFLDCMFNTGSLAVVIGFEDTPIDITVSEIRNFSDVKKELRLVLSDVASHIQVQESRFFANLSTDQMTKASTLKNFH